MSRRQTRAPRSTVRRETVRKLVNETAWNEMKKAPTDCVDAIEKALGHIESASPLVQELSKLANIYDAPALRAAIEELERLGLGGKNYRDVVRHDQGMWEDFRVGTVVEAVERYVNAGVGLNVQAACERVVSEEGIGALSHDAAVKFARRAFEEWRDKTDLERAPALSKAGPNADPTGGFRKFVDIFSEMSPEELSLMVRISCEEG